MQQQIKDYTSSSIYVFAWHIALGILGTVRLGTIRRGQACKQAVSMVGITLNLKAYPLDVISAVKKTYGCIEQGGECFPIQLNVPFHNIYN